MILVIALLLTVAIPANTTLTFYNGSMYLEFSENAKMSYVAGLSDMANTLIEHYEPEVYKKYKEALKDMSLGQEIKILHKYLEENPEELHFTVAISFLNAIDEIVFKE